MALATLSNPSSNQAQWAKALRELDMPPESPKFWTNIANDPAYPSARRAEAIFKLFERHIPPGIKLPELGELLGGAKWLRNADVTFAKGPSGLIPLDTSGKGTVYHVLVLGTPDGNHSARSIYVKLSKRVEPEALAHLLRKEKISSDLKEAKVFEYALCSTIGLKDGWKSIWIIRTKVGDQEGDHSESMRRLYFRQ